MKLLKFSTSGYNGGLSRLYGLIGILSLICCETAVNPKALIDPSDETMAIDYWHESFEFDDLQPSSAPGCHSVKDLVMRNPKSESNCDEAGISLADAMKSGNCAAKVTQKITFKSNQGDIEGLEGTKIGGKSVPFLRLGPRIAKSVNARSNVIFNPVLYGLQTSDVILKSMNLGNNYTQMGCNKVKLYQQEAKRMPKEICEGEIQSNGEFKPSASCVLDADLDGTGLYALPDPNVKCPDWTGSKKPSLTFTMNVKKDTKKRAISSDEEVAKAFQPESLFAIKTTDPAKIICEVITAPDRDETKIRAFKDCLDEQAPDSEVSLGVTMSTGVKGLTSVQKDGRNTFKVPLDLSILFPQDIDFGGQYVELDSLKAVGLTMGRITGRDENSLCRKGELFYENLEDGNLISQTPAEIKSENGIVWFQSTAASGWPIFGDDDMSNESKLRDISYLPEDMKADCGYEDFTAYNLRIMSKPLTLRNSEDVTWKAIESKISPDQKCQTNTSLKGSGSWEEIMGGLRTIENKNCHADIEVTLQSDVELEPVDDKGTRAFVLNSVEFDGEIDKLNNFYLRGDKQFLLEKIQFPSQSYEGVNCSKLSGELSHSNSLKGKFNPVPLDNSKSNLNSLTLKTPISVQDNEVNSFYRYKLNGRVSSDECSTNKSVKISLVLALRNVEISDASTPTRKPSHPNLVKVGALDKMALEGWTSDGIFAKFVESGGEKEKEVCHNKSLTDIEKCLASIKGASADQAIRIFARYKLKGRAVELATDISGNRVPVLGVDEKMIGIGKKGLKLDHVDNIEFANKDANMRDRDCRIGAWVKGDKKNPVSETSPMYEIPLELAGSEYLVPAQTKVDGLTQLFFKPDIPSDMPPSNDPSGKKQPNSMGRRCEWDQAVEEPEIEFVPESKIMTLREFQKTVPPTEEDVVSFFMNDKEVCAQPDSNFTGQAGGGKEERKLGETVLECARRQPGDLKYIFYKFGEEHVRSDRAIVKGSEVPATRVQFSPLKHVAKIGENLQVTQRFLFGKDDYNGTFTPSGCETGTWMLKRTDSPPELAVAVSKETKIEALDHSKIELPPSSFEVDGEYDFYFKPSQDNCKWTSNEVEIMFTLEGDFFKRMTKPSDSKEATENWIIAEFLLLQSDDGVKFTPAMRSTSLASIEQFISENKIREYKLEKTVILPYELENSISVGQIPGMKISADHLHGFESITHVNFGDALKMDHFKGDPQREGEDTLMKNCTKGSVVWEEWDEDLKKMVRMGEKEVANITSTSASLDIPISEEKDMLVRFEIPPENNCNLLPTNITLPRITLRSDVKSGDKFNDGSEVTLKFPGTPTGIRKSSTDGLLYYFSEVASQIGAVKVEEVEIDSGGGAFKKIRTPVVKGIRATEIQIDDAPGPLNEILSVKIDKGDMPRNIGCEKGKWIARYENLPSSSSILSEGGSIYERQDIHVKFTEETMNSPIEIYFQPEKLDKKCVMTSFEGFKIEYGRRALMDGMDDPLKHPMILTLQDAEKIDQGSICKLKDSLKNFLDCKIKANEIPFELSFNLTPKSDGGSGFPLEMSAGSVHQTVPSAFFDQVIESNGEIFDLKNFVQSHGNLWLTEVEFYNEYSDKKCQDLKPMVSERKSDIDNIEILREHDLKSIEARAQEAASEKGMDKVALNGEILTLDPPYQFQVNNELIFAMVPKDQNARCILKSSKNPRLSLKAQLSQTKRDTILTSTHKPYIRWAFTKPVLSASIIAALIPTMVVILSES